MGTGVSGLYVNAIVESKESTKDNSPQSESNIEDNSTTEPDVQHTNQSKNDFSKGESKESTKDNSPQPESNIEDDSTTEPDAQHTNQRKNDFSNFPKKIHTGKQEKHIIGANNYIEGKSVLTISIAHAQKLIDQFSGTGTKITDNKERVNFGEVIGIYINQQTREQSETTVGVIHYSEKGTHIVPSRPD